MLVIVVDNTRVIGQAVHRLLESTGAKTAVVGSLQGLALAFQASGRPDLVIVNVTGHVSEREIAAQLRRCDYAGRTLAFVDDLFTTTEPALARSGTVERIVRPTSPTALDEVLHRALLGSGPSRSSAPDPGPSTPASFHGIVGRSPKLLEIFSRIGKVAGGDANVCIYGESGTGKELIARAIHYASPRRDRPLITLDCTTIPEGLMESHVLGHVRGAFTGAVEHREGVFSLAHTGTLFIDELCELNPVLQAKLLRVIQNREFIPIGGTKPKRTDVRIITATNKDLKGEVDNGRFREDLYYRVAVFMIDVPPLRERLEDIPLLVDHFVKKLGALYGKAIVGIDRRALKRLVDMPWPGNIRQLENFVEQAIVLADGDRLTELELFASHGPARTADVSSLATFEPGLPLRQVEQRHILNTLRKAGGNRTEAARQLGISLRSLQYKLKEYAADP